MKRFLAIFSTSLFLLLILMSTIVLAHSSGSMTINEAWIREAPPNAPVMAAYLTIENHTSKDNALTSISSSSFERIEIHTSFEENGMARMKQVDKINVKAEAKVQLKPGGFHLMLIKPKKRFKAGDKISMTFQFADGSKAISTLEVKKVSGGEDHSHHHMDGDSQHDQHMDHKDHSEHNDMHEHHHDK